MGNPIFKPGGSLLKSQFNDMTILKFASFDEHIYIAVGMATIK